jgi:hypothetical protein
MTAATARAASAPTERPNVLELARDDGAIAAAIGVAAGGRPRLPAIVLLLVGGLPGVVAIVATGDGAPRGVVAGAIAWAVLGGGLASARPLTDRLRWAVPPALRALEYGGVLWVAAVAGASALPAAFALLCATAYHHYDVVYGLRHRGVSLPRWVQVAGGGWDGRLLLAAVLLLAGGLPAGFFVLAVALAVLFAGETIAEWRHIGRAQRPLYDDEEDDPE